MQIETTVTIRAPRERVWSLVTDIANAVHTISGIEEIEILEKPSRGLVGLKWRETRTLFGKTATEVMWITDARPREYYTTEARSHGAVYRSRIFLADTPEGTRLGMRFIAQPETLTARVMSVIFGFMMKGATEKALRQDLEDIRRAAEKG